MKRLIKIWLILLALSVVLPGPASEPLFAATATSSFTVQASVAASCTISTAALNFGSYDPVVANATTPLDANGSVTVSCSKGAVTTIGLNQGANPATGSTALDPLRQMANGSERLRYDLYQTAAGTGVWGGIGTANVKSYTATSKAPVTFTIFGRIPENQDVATGSYSDTVTATISF